MSLFGSSPEDADLTAATSRQEQSSSLFDDEARPSKSSGGLFNDDTAGGDSPWSMPTPKKASREQFVKTLLPASEVPESYVDAYDTLSASEYRVEGGKISIAGVMKVLEGSRIADQERIVRLVNVEGGRAIGRNEFNVLLALISLAQEGDEASLDSVDERRESECGYVMKLQF